MNSKFKHICIAGDYANSFILSREKALTEHYPAYITDPNLRTRISVILNAQNEVDDFLFEYQELLDNSYWRSVDLSGLIPKVTTHTPQYEGRRMDFIDVEWEFVIGRISNPFLQTKIKRWAADPRQMLSISLCYDDKDKSIRYAEKFRRRLPDSVTVEMCELDAEKDKQRDEELMAMAKYLHYFYQASYQLNHVPTELPEDEVDKAWAEIDDTMKRSNFYNVMSIPHKMKLLGHDRNDWNSFYALTASEIELLTEVEHNRWCVERLIQGSRPCTDDERKEIETDLRCRLSDPAYAKANPISLKKRYKTERNAHFDLCAFSELGVDETGLHVSRYDRDLTAAIPLIVKTFHDHYNANLNG